MGENSTTKDLTNKLRDCEGENICPSLRTIKQNFLKTLIERSKIDANTEKPNKKNGYEGIRKSNIGITKNIKDT